METLNTTTVNSIKKVSKKSALYIIDKKVLITPRAIIASDFETYFQCDTPTQWTVNGSGVISLEVLENLKNVKSVEINFNASPAYIAFPGRKIVLNDLEDPKQFPEIETDYNTEKSGKINAEQVAGVLDFLCKDDLRPAMCGAYIGADIVGTNAHILRWSKSEYSGTPFILPRAGVELIKANLKNVKFWNVEQTKDHVFLSADSLKISCLKIDETYPNYLSVIPKDNDGLIQINKKQLSQTLKGLKSSMNKHTQQVTITANNAELINVTAVDIDRKTEAAQDLTANVESLENGFKIGFNAKYLETVCSNVNSDIFSISLSTPNRAGIVNDEILVMPVMLNN